MNILHYTLGLPPFRKGGLTKYSLDLMIEQSKSHEVTLLYANSGLTLKSQKFIEKKNNFDFHVYEINNTQPIPLLEGIKNPIDFIENKTQIKSFQNEINFFLQNIKPDVFHIHTLMGLPLSFVEAVKNKGIKIIFTTHDYFGLCPKVNFINQNNCWCDNTSNCFACNFNAPSTLYLKYLRNSKFLLQYKNLLKWIKPGEKKKTSTPPTPSIMQSHYSLLRDYYMEILKLVDCFHFNSSISHEVYQSFFPINKHEIINLRHANIKDDRKPVCFDKTNIRFGYIGSTEYFKGFPVLLKALERLFNDGIKNWELNVYGDSVDLLSPIQSKIKFKGAYRYENISRVFSAIDILIMPSKCKETFGFVALEAFSHGIPVVLSNHCGVKDILKEVTPELIVEPEENDFYPVMREILTQTEKIALYNQKIIAADFSFNLSAHVEEINQLYLRNLQ